MPTNPRIKNTPVKAGFPNPAEEAGGMALDLNQLLVKHPISTYYLRIEGDDLGETGVSTGDIAVVDKALQPKNGDLVVAIVEDEFVLRRLKQLEREAQEFTLWGVVTYIIHRTRG